jgi:hypothetical protein
MIDNFEKEIAKEFVSQTAVKSYEDIAHPTANAAGQLISFIPRTIRLWLGKWEKWIINGEYSIKETEKLLEKKLANIAEDKITEPEAYVAIPAIQQLSYSLDSINLREMYANLLASSMNKDTKTHVHPAFVDIIKQLCPDEAKLLKYLSNKPTQPLIDVVLKYKKGSGYIVKVKNFTTIAENLCDNPSEIFSYLDNLERLKMINILDNIYINDTSIYSPLEEHPQIQSIINSEVENNFAYEIRKHSFELTAFAENFIKVCL